MPGDQLSLFSKKSIPQVPPPPVHEVPVPTPESTLMQTLPAYALYLHSAGYSKHTPEVFFSDIKTLAQFLPFRKVQELKKQDIHQWLGMLEKTYKLPRVAQRDLIHQ